MAIPRDVTPYGSQTVVGPGWPNVEEEELSSAAAQFEAFAATLTGSVVPDQTSQLASLTDGWRGLGAVSATGEATSIIGGHEANAARAATIALHLHEMEAMVVRTKTMANATAAEVQQECMAIEAMSAFVGNARELIESRIKMGLAQNAALIDANTGELAGSLGVPPTTSISGTPPGAASTQQPGQQGAEQATQTTGQMIGMAAQLPGQLMGMATQLPQQLSQPLQQLAQPLQSLSSMFSGRSGTGVSSSASPFSSFSNHPLAGGSGAGGGSGVTKAASMPGAGGSPARTPAMAKLVGASPRDIGVPVAAAAGAGVGLAPVGAGMGMLPQRGEGGVGNIASLSAPAPLEHDLDEDDDDEW